MLEKKKIEVEVRPFTCEVRAIGDKPPVITGRPIVFRSLSENLGDFFESVEPDSVEFDEDLRCDHEHDGKYILGTAARGTLKMTKDSMGWTMEVHPPATTWAADLCASIQRGDVDGGSMAFSVKPGGQQWTGNKRLLTAIKVRRVTVTGSPAYRGTVGTFAVRSISDILQDRDKCSDLKNLLNELDRSLSGAYSGLVKAPPRHLDGDLQRRLKELDKALGGFFEQPMFNSKRELEKLDEQTSSDRRQLLKIVATAVQLAGYRFR